MSILGKFEQFWNTVNQITPDVVVEDVNSDVPDIHVVVKVKMTTMIGHFFTEDEFHGPYYISVQESGGLAIYEIGADLDPIAYYPPGNYHSVQTYDADEYADLQLRKMMEKEETKP